MDKLRFPVGLGPRRRAAAFGHRHEGGQESRADILGKGKIRLPVAGVQVVVEDAAHAPRPAPVGNEEVLVGPGLELG